ncbi:hypothetical protein E3T23_06585 [Cryobacterium cheniae]|uniref:Uncharacterized protein n=1 Tax=Cryobacterium cheniae TaxID=1259262 RepID=A0A4R8XRS6_9MICO|nr:hypothetical protein [Cryobacterium cheniae]TFC81159.1 hypothetical protein E3T23_06585 [Cryobacterium cheniae]
MTTTKSATLTALKAGDQIHILQSGLTVAVSNGYTTGGAVLKRGQTITLTDAMIFENQDRNGDSFLDLDAAGQVQKFGRVMFARGPWLSSETVLVPGSVEHVAERERRRLAAWAMPDEVERGEALRAVSEEFGPAASKQSTTKYSGA